MVHSRFLPALVAGLSTFVFAQGSVAAEPLVTPERETELLKEVKVPEGFEAKIFAAAPAVNYPVFVAAAPDGTLYVSSDKNGSLDRGPHRGRVLRVRDLDGDGHADEVKEFVKDVDSPRGLLWDKDRLYLLHPPHLSVFIDRDGDGVSDEQKILVKNIAFGFKDRPADHSSNGIEMGVDGWIYCAIGDFGFMQAEGTDGRTLQMRAGGVVRVRPDGTGLELYSRGTRNILEVAVGPKLEMFARDNTNDGDGWDIRFHHFTPWSEHGYPSLFKHFADEIIEPLAIYGGGSGCGAMFLSEPGFPEGYNNAPYTADWGREWIYRHPIRPRGATFQVEQHEFVRAPRVTDLDVDAMSRIYVASWKGATFTYAGEDVGFIVRVTPKGYTPQPLPEFATLKNDALIGQLDLPSHRRRLAAQRELVGRTLSDADVKLIEAAARDTKKAVESRIAAVFLLKQARGFDAHSFLAELSKDARIREFCLRAIFDGTGALDSQYVTLLRDAMTDENPNVRREACFAIGRLGDKAEAKSLAPLLADSDEIVAHTAMQAMRRLQASEECFRIVDDASSTSELRASAFRVLQALHQPVVVNGLLQRLGSQTRVEARRALIAALARLHSMEGEWKGDSWGTRPDTSGPYYQPVEWSESAKIERALRQALSEAQGDEAVFIVNELGRHKVQSDDTLLKVVSLAEESAAVVPAAVTQLARAERIPERAVPLLIKTATEVETPETTRAEAVVALGKVRSEEAAMAMLQAMPMFPEGRRGSREAQRARQSFLRLKHADEVHGALEQVAAQLNGERSVWADAALLVLTESKSASPEARETVAKALEKGWSEPKRQAQLLRAVALAEHRGSKEKVVDALGSGDKEVVEAAKLAARVLRLDRERKPKAEPMISELKVEDVLAKVSQMKGDMKTGQELFTRQTCVNCHTVSADEPLRGPFLGNIAKTYKRRELAEAILVPNKSVAQGFVANNFVLKDGTELDGFVVQEGAGKVVVRTVAAQEVSIAAEEIAQRKKSERSLMPEGLAANLSVKELASLLDYLEGLAAEQN